LLLEENNNVNFLEVREVLNGKAVSKETFVLPIQRASDTTFTTPSSFIHNIKGCSSRCHRDKKVRWSRKTGFRVGDEPCEFTATFQVIKAHKHRPESTKNTIFIQEN
jgi:hypothetical protein